MDASQPSTQAAPPPNQSSTATTSNPGYPQEAPANNFQHPPPNSGPNYSQLEVQPNPAPYPPANYTPGYYPPQKVQMPNNRIPAAPPNQGHYNHTNQQSRSQGKRTGQGWQGNSNSKESEPSSNRGLERMMATAEFLQRASAYMDRRGRSRSSQSNRRRK
ncbi:hypothetical protein PCASD_04428 [Puccinia coronata f. sp. avenae]|uniref:Uncharacterized protein n=1 Tax=Puccinia coronata f. sp. avenae TaxID=200324 RepID=A0A2N5VBW1_9BASI|nr:hypothetical protein PCASD_04428 [Puccinia coronata f. sp. avenae]